MDFFSFCLYDFYHSFLFDRLSRVIWRCIESGYAKEGENVMALTELRVKELLKERRWTTKVLAEKTGMSESYLTHIKNGTRRWNEDALKKIAQAFELDPIDLFAHRKANHDEQLPVPHEELPTTPINVQLVNVPVMGDIPSTPSPYNNQLMQVTTGYKEIFVPILNATDESLFCLCVENNGMSPRFVRGDYLIISPASPAVSGDIVAVEYKIDRAVKGIMQVTFMDEFVVLESVNHKQPPVALVKGKDQFTVIGKVIYRYQRMV